MGSAITSARISHWMCGTRSLQRYQVDHCITAQAYCLVQCASSFWHHVIFNMSQLPLHGTPSSVCQQKIVWDAFTKSSLRWHFFRSRMSAGDQSGARLLASRPIRSQVEDANALYLSSQRAVPLRCDLVNDNFSTSGTTAHPFDDGRFPVPPHAPHPAGATPPPPVFLPLLH
jgi:hypothetical protein